MAASPGEACVTPVLKSRCYSLMQRATLRLGGTRWHEGMSVHAALPSSVARGKRSASVRTGLRKLYTLSIHATKILSLSTCLACHAL